MDTPFQSVLAIIQEREDVQSVLHRSFALAAEQGAVHAVRVVYEGVADLTTQHVEQSQKLKKFILHAENAALHDALDAARSCGQPADAVAVWNRRIWEGAIHAADRIDADIIVKACRDPGPKGPFSRTPDDWNLLRHSKHPVLLVQRERWPAQPTVVAAIDAFDETHASLSRRILTTAKAATTRLGGRLHIVSAFPALERWVSHLDRSRTYRKMIEDIENDIRRTVGDISNAVGLHDYELHVVEGSHRAILSHTLHTLDTDLLVVGTKARRGIEGAAMGNTSERLIHGVECDVLAVP